MKFSAILLATAAAVSATQPDNSVVDLLNKRDPEPQVGPGNGNPGFGPGFGKGKGKFGRGGRPHWWWTRSAEGAEEVEDAELLSRRSADPQGPGFGGPGGPGFGGPRGKFGRGKGKGPHWFWDRDVEDVEENNAVIEKRQAPGAPGAPGNGPFGPGGPRGGHWCWFDHDDDNNGPFNGGAPGPNKRSPQAPGGGPGGPGFGGPGFGRGPRYCWSPDNDDNNGPGPNGPGPQKREAQGPGFGGPGGPGFGFGGPRGKFGKGRGHWWGPRDVEAEADQE